MRPTNVPFIDIWLLTAVFAIGGSAIHAIEEPPTDREKANIRSDAQDLYKAHRLHEALPLYEKLGVWYPDDPTILTDWGFCLVALAQSERDQEKAKAMRLRGRKIMLRAREKGGKSDLIKIVLEAVPEDGGQIVVAKTPVEKALNEGEQAFVKGDFDGALKAYAKALELDPKNYLALLFTGDVYFKEKDYVRAGKWFEKATRVAPDREAGWRYWGDALAHNGKVEDAKGKFIEAVIAHPYIQRTWRSLNVWAKLAKVNAGHPQIDPPVRLDSTDKLTLTVDRGTVADESGEVWLVYGLERALWRTEKFAKTYPKEKAYRRTLAEEASAFSATAAAARKLKEKDKKISPALEQLVALDQAGLLEPFVLFAKADPDIARDYVPYRAKNRDRLRKYLSEFYISGPVEQVEPEE